VARRRRLSSGSSYVEGLSFLGLEPAVEEAVVKEVRALTAELHADAQANLSGGVLKSRTGRLLKSLKTKIIHRKGISVVGVVVQRGNGRAFYGRMWERGHDRHGPAPGPADKLKVSRPFLKPALDAKRASARSRIEAVVKTAARSV
jgi:hypothetical protein